MAHWFYSDEYVANEVKAASYKHNLRNCSMQEFSKHMFRHIPFLRKHGNNVEEILEIGANTRSLFQHTERSCSMKI